MSEENGPVAASKATKWGRYAAAVGAVFGLGGGIYATDFMHKTNDVHVQSAPATNVDVSKKDRDALKSKFSGVAAQPTIKQQESHKNNNDKTARVESPSDIAVVGVGIALGALIFAGIGRSVGAAKNAIAKEVDDALKAKSAEAGEADFKKKITDFLDAQTPAKPTTPPLKRPGPGPS